MIWQTTQEVLPVTRLPKPEALRVRIVIAHRRVAVRSAMQIQIDELLEIRSDNLISVNEEDLLEVHREEDVEEEDLVRPDDPLLLLLRAEPRGPFVRDELVLEPIFGGKVRDEFLSKNVDM